MTIQRKMRAGLVLTGLILFCFSAAEIRAASADDSAELFPNQHQAGFRLGVWNNRGDTPPPAGQVNETGEFKTNIHGSSAYVEAYFGYRLLSLAMVELSLGSVNRGSVTITDQGASDIGNLIIYPVVVQLKFYTGRLPGTKLYPFGIIGGGLYHGRRNVQFTSSQSYYSNWQEESATDFNYVVGGGIDWPIASQIGLELCVKYMPMNLSLVTIEKQDALAFTVGVKYLYSRK